MTQMHFKNHAACNAHCHVFGPLERFPYRAVGSYAPDGDAPKESLYALNDRLGFQRCVVVQSVCHGFDNSVTEDALLGRPNDYRGIALLELNTRQEEIARLDALGFRGVRFNLMSSLGTTPDIDQILEFAKRLEPFGWHLQLHGHEASWLAIEKALLASPVDIVIDHLGRIDPTHFLERPAFECLQSLLDSGHVWLKTSGLDRLSHSGRPYTDAIPLARTLVQAYPERVVWGNDWPHTHHREVDVSDEFLASLIHTIAPTEALWHRMMVDNPQQLYRFS